MSTSQECPIYREKQDIIKIAMEHKIPFTEAKLMYLQDKTHRNPLESMELLENQQLKDERVELRKRVKNLEKRQTTTENKISNYKQALLIFLSWKTISMLRGEHCSSCEDSWALYLGKCP